MLSHLCKYNADLPLQRRSKVRPEQGKFGIYGFYVIIYQTCEFVKWLEITIQ